MKRKKMISLATAILLSASMATTVPVLADSRAKSIIATETSSEAARVSTSSYNASAAVAWALNESAHCASSNAGNLCAQYVSQCLQNGGLGIPTEPYPNRIMTWVQNNGCGSYLNVNEDSLAKLSAGDVIVWCCDNHSGLYGLHTIFVTSVDHGTRTLRYCSNNNYRHNASLSFSGITNFGVRCNACRTSRYVHSYIIHLGTGSNPPVVANRPALPNPWFYADTPTDTYGTLLVNQFWPKVQWIQQSFNVIQNVGLEVDGHYGESTKNAAIAFQQAHGLTADGIVGPSTTGKIVECLNSRGYYPDHTATPKVDSPHTHVWDSGKITMAPTCTTEGVMTYTCTSGDGATTTKTIPATGHKWNSYYTIDKEATTTEEGIKSIHCSVCNAVKEESTISIPKLASPEPEPLQLKAVPMYRLYNPNSSEHFYTGNLNEKNHLAAIGWRYEGIGWDAPDSGKPVYRLYNPNSGDHHYTTSASEKNYLAAIGWRYEGIGWYSGGTKPIYRQYNPNAKTGSHNFTSSKRENDYLASIGWHAEDIAWYGLAEDKD